MMEALEELESVTSDLGIDIHSDADELRERIEKLPEPEADDPNSEVRRLPNSHDGDNSNVAIAALFDMLRTGGPGIDG